MSVRNCRKLPLTVQAVQYDGHNLREIAEFAGDHLFKRHAGYVINDPLTILTLEGYSQASVMDWIIKGVKGEFYPCKPDVFDTTYELLDSS